MAQEWWSKMRPTTIERVALDSDPEFLFDLYVNSEGLSWHSKFETVDVPWSSVTNMNFKIAEPRDRDSYRSLGWVMGPGSPLVFALIRKLRLRRSSSTLVVQYGTAQELVTLRVGRRSDVLWHLLKPAFKQSQRLAKG
jgi:hypothetical protein